jgi:hypothetical protein
MPKRSVGPPFYTAKDALALPQGRRQGIRLRLQTYLPARRRLPLAFLMPSLLR